MIPLLMVGVMFFQTHMDQMARGIICRVCNLRDDTITAADGLLQMVQDIICHNAALFMMNIFVLEITTV